MKDGRATMDFFAAQARARLRTRLLLVPYVLALAAVAVAMAIAAGLLYTPLAMYGVLPVHGDVVVDGRRFLSSFVEVLVHGVPRGVYLWTAAATAVVMVGASLARWWRLRDGGEAVAELMRADPVERHNATLAQTRLINVVEEMAIASGIAVPRVYVLAGERGINAMVAGYSSDEAVVIVTEGAFAALSRDELQAVMGHEFSHILNGDMRFNVQLMAMLYGVQFIGTTGTNMVHEAIAGSIGVERAAKRLDVLNLVPGAVFAFIGYWGLLCGRFIKAAISRQREHLADASAVRFTRHAESVAGALDTIVATKRGSYVWNPCAEEVSHMFYAQAVNVWLGAWFATHPHIEARIRAVDPTFQRIDYRRRRGTDTSPSDRPVAVISGGEVVRIHDPLQAYAQTNAVAPGRAFAETLVASVGRPAPEHLGIAQALLARVPATLREQLATPDGAAGVLFALALEDDLAVRAKELAVLGERRGEAAVAGARDAYSPVSALGRPYQLVLAELALPVLKAQEQRQRNAFLADHQAVVEADQRVTLREFVLHALLRQHLREDAGRAIRSAFKSVEEVKADACAVLSVVAHTAGGEQAGAAFEAGKRWLGVEVGAILPVAELSTQRIGQALERLRLLQALEKPRILKACTDAAAADDNLRLAEIEFVRLVAATLGCPMPPVLAAIDPGKLAA